MSDVRDIVESVRVPASHPSLPGHFPDRPIVPGVVLLDFIAAALERAGAGRIAQISAVKFIAPLLPDQDAELSIRCERIRARFSIERNGATILRGEGELA